MLSLPLQTATATLLLDVLLLSTSGPNATATSTAVDLDMRACGKVNRTSGRILNEDTQPVIRAIGVSHSLQR